MSKITKAYSSITLADAVDLLVASGDEITLSLIHI